MLVKREDKAMKRDERGIADREAGKDVVKDRSAGLCSLELCSGTAKMTKGFRKAGFRDTVTLDNDKKRESVSNLSLQQLEDMMAMRDGDERWLDHPTNRRFHTIWAGPCCTTYSIAQSTKIYRTEGEFPYILCQLIAPTSIIQFSQPNQGMSFRLSPSNSFRFYIWYTRLCNRSGGS